MAIRLTRANSEYLSITSGVLDYNSNYTISLWLYFVSLPSAYAHIIDIAADAGASNFDALVTDASNLLTYSSTTAFGGADGVSGTSLSTGTWYHIAMVRSNVAVRTLYLNAASDCVNTSDSTGRTAATRMEVGRFVGSGDHGDIRIFGMKMWQRALTVSEITAEMRQAMPISGVSLYGAWPFLVGSRTVDFSGHAHTWTEFNTPTDEDPPNVAFTGSELFVQVATGGVAYTLSVDPGVFIETGTAVTLKKASQIVAGSGTFTETGTAVTLRKGSKFVAGSGAFVIPDNDVGLRADHRVVAGNGHFSVTGTDATMHHGRTLVVTAGAFTETGTPVTLLLEHRLPVGSGTFVETGTAVTLVSDQGARLVVDSGEFILTGIDVALNPSEVIVSVVTYGNWSAAFTIPAGSEWRVLCAIDSCDNPKIRAAVEMRENSGIVQRPIR